MPFLGSTLVRFPIATIEIILDRLQIVSCDDIVTLHAQVVNPLVGQIYEWVQLSGNTVIFLTPTNDETVMFQQTLVRDDKVFRFYVNRGLAKESFVDILVSAVPREDLPEIKNSPRLFARNFADESMVIASIMPGLSAPGVVTLNNTLRGVKFNSAVVTNTAVPYENFVKEYQIVDVTGGTETILTTIPYPANGYFGLPANRSIRVDAIIKNNGVVFKDKGTPGGYYLSPTLDTYDQGTIHLGTSNLSTSFENFVYSIITRSVDDEILFSLQTGVFANTVQRFPLSLELAPLIEEPLVVNLSNGKSYSSVVRLDLGIGGLG